MSSAVLQHETQPIVACTVSRDVQIFDLLIEDMEAALGVHGVICRSKMQSRSLHNLMLHHLSF